MTNLFKKTTLFLIIISFLLALNIASVAAQGTLDLTGKLKNVGGNAGYSSEVSENTIPNTVGNIIKALLSLLGIIFMVYIVYAGYLWMIARGNEEQLTKAKAIIRGSIIGLIIVLAAYAITQFVLTSIINATGYTSS